MNCLFEVEILTSTTLSYRIISTDQSTSGIRWLNAFAEASAKAQRSRSYLIQIKKVALHNLSQTTTINFNADN